MDTTLRFVGMLLMLLAFAHTSCGEPTQIRVRLHTDVPGTDGVSVALWAGVADAFRKTEPSSTTSGPWSSDGIVGSLVAVPPSGNRGARVSLRAVLALGGDPKRCFDDPAGCIVAERSVAYVSAKTALVPIGLYRACLGVSCASGLTCNARGACVSSALDATQCTGTEGCILEGDPATPPGVIQPVIVPDAGTDGAGGALPGLSPPDVVFRDSDPRVGVVEGMLQLVPKDNKGTAFSYSIDAVTAAGVVTRLAEIDARGALVYRFLPGTDLPLGHEFAEVRARSADGRASSPTRVRLDNYVRRVDVGANAGGDALAVPRAAYDPLHNRLMLLGLDLDQRLALRRCNGSGGDCVAVPFDDIRAAKANVLPAVALMDTLSADGRLLVAVGTPSLTVFRCAADGTSCVRKDLSGGGSTPSLAMDPVSRALFVAAKGVRVGAGQPPLVVHRCELDLSNCTSFVATAQADAEEFVHLHVDRAAPIASRLLVVRSASTVRCNVDTGTCAPVPGLTSPGQLLASDLDPTRRILFTLRSDLRRCDLSTDVCSTLPTGGTFNSAAARVDGASGALHVVGTVPPATRSVLRCDDDTCTSLTLPVSLGYDPKGQDVVLGSGPQQGRWLTVVNISDSTNTARAWVADCNLQGTDCAMTDASASNARGNSVAIRDRPIDMAIDEIGARVLVASTNPSTSNRPALFVCDLEGANCRYEGIQSPTADGAAPDVGHRPHLLYDAARDGLLLTTSDESPIRQGRPGVFVCDRDGRNCTYRHAVPDGAGAGAAPKWALVDALLRGSGESALSVLSAGQGTTGTLHSRCSSTATGCRTRLFNVPTNCTAVSLAATDDRILAMCTPGELKECDVVSGVCTQLWDDLPGTFLGRRGTSGAFFGNFFGYGNEAGANVLGCAPPIGQCAERWVERIPGGGAKVTGATATDAKRGVTYVALSMVQGTQGTVLLRCPEAGPCQELLRFRCGGQYPFIGATAIPRIDALHDRLYVAFRDQDNLGRPALLILDLF